MEGRITSHLDLSSFLPAKRKTETKKIWEERRNVRMDENKLRQREKENEREREKEREGGGGGG